MSLIVYGTAVDPEDVTQALGLSPTWQRRRGEPNHPGDRPTKRGMWKRSFVGPTPVNAPTLANDLARDLLGELPSPLPSWSNWGDDVEVDITLSFAVHRLLNFSYELDTSVAKKIGEVGTALVCNVYDVDDSVRAGSFDDPDAAEHEVSVSLIVRGEELDPNIVTSMLGLDPTSSGRAGDPIQRGQVRARPLGFWEFDVRSRPPKDVNQLIRALLGRLPTNPVTWDTLRRDYQIRLHTSFTAEGLSGHFYLEADVVRALATMGCTLDFAFYNLNA
ncbi:DUF4279 domain-containing protein [Pendulispora brunnea]|uniref:DUF4279 domain-containing protein n=1 Tax=Pendulispora brunnea TaxID=2905690 RepID=A0ABZ2K0I8_9BACT